jgi:hypothetical protein
LLPTLEALTEEVVSQPNLKVIMTGGLVDNPEDTAILAEHLRIAKYSNVPFCLIDITCDRGEHGQRLETPARIAEGKSKLRDGHVLQQLLEQHKRIENLPEELLTVRNILDELKHGRGIVAVLEREVVHADDVKKQFERVARARAPTRVAQSADLDAFRLAASCMSRRCV